MTTTTAHIIPIGPEVYLATTAAAEDLAVAWGLTHPDPQQSPQSILEDHARMWQALHAACRQQLADTLSLLENPDPALIAQATGMSPDQARQALLTPPHTEDPDCDCDLDAWHYAGAAGEDLGQTWHLYYDDHHDEPDEPDDQEHLDQARIFAHLQQAITDNLDQILDDLHHLHPTPPH